MSVGSAGPAQQRLACGAALLWLVLGCSDPECAPRICDIRGNRCQRDTMEATACLRGEEPRDVDVDVYLRQDFVQQIRREVDEVEREAFVVHQAAFALLGLEPMEDDYDAYLKDYYRQIAGFYDTDEDRVVILHDDEPLESPRAVSLLVHEFSHALQLAPGGDEADGGAAVKSAQQRLARAALREGDAVWTEDRALVLSLGEETDHIAWHSIYEAWAEDSWTQYVPEAHRVRYAYRYFAYPFGARFVERVHAAGGPAKVRAFVQEPPQTVAQVMEMSTTGLSPHPFMLPDLAEHEMELIVADALGSFVVASLIEAAWIRVSGEEVVDMYRRGEGGFPGWLDVQQDSLSVWQRADGHLVSIYRLRLGGAVQMLAEVREVLLAAQPGSASLHVYLEDNDLVLVASTDDAWLVDTLLADPPSWLELSFAEVQERIQAPVSPSVADINVWVAAYLRATDRYGAH